MYKEMELNHKLIIVTEYAIAEYTACISLIYAYKKATFLTGRGVL
jgi:hypothetical protein